MYIELVQRREEAARIAMTGDAEAIKELAKKQMSVAAETKE